MTSVVNAMIKIHKLENCICCGCTTVIYEVLLNEIKKSNEGEDTNLSFLVRGGDRRNVNFQRPDADETLINDRRRRN